MRQLMVLAAAALMLATTSMASAQTFNLDPVHSMVVFRIQHLGVSFVYGRFNEPTGTFVIDEDPAKMSFDVQVQTANVDTSNTKRDAHLRSADFFEVEKYPTIHFKSTSVKKGENEGEYIVTGDMSLHGVTRPVTVTLKHIATKKGQNGKARAGFETTFTVKRSDYGMTFMNDNGMVGDEVTLMVGLEGIEQ